LKVTVLIDTYNHERFIECAITSVLAQDMPLDDLEILVVDDGSTDQTPEIVRRFEPRVRLIRKLNGGQASAFNAGIAEARGEIIAFLDGDDWWAPEKLRRVLETLDRDPAVGIVGHGYIFVYSDGQQRVQTLRDGFRFRANTLAGAQLLRVRGAFLGTSRMTVRVSVLRKILPVPPKIVIQADEYLSTMAAALSEVQILPEPLFYYRVHDSNAFHMTNTDPQRLRRKQEVLAELAQQLNEKLPPCGVGARVVHAITGRVQADADQLRLMLDGGWPWETVRAEWTIHRVMYPHVQLSNLAFKIMSLLPAMVLPPKFYYSVRHRVSKSELYLWARKRWLPIPEMPHLRGEKETSAQ
jgi:glycosyltransferase involved in cell wall biosynthesis